MRFYVSPEAIFTERRIIEIKDREEIHHIRDVMRLKKDTSVSVFDGKGKECSGDIKKIDRDSVVIEIKGVVDNKGIIPYKATLYQAIPKKTRMDFIIEKAVELGADAIVPMVTERTIAALKGEKRSAKVERWRRVGKAASKQCGRVKLPAISDVTDFNSALEASRESDLVVFAALDKDARPLRSILRDSSQKNIAIFVGPEGDFSQDEIAAAKGQGYSICSLGPMVLRVDTAAIYILSCLNYEGVV